MISDVMKINELELIENIEILFNSKVILYGAGYQGVETLKKLRAIGVPVSFFCDSNVQKWDCCIDGVTILSIEDLVKLDKAAYLTIIITTDKSSNIDRIIQILTELKLNTEKIFTGFGLLISLAQNINNQKISNSDRARFLDIYYNNVKLQDLLNVRKLDTWQSGAIIQSVERSINDIENILVYQPGKVGSSTVSDSLAAIGIPNTHVHFLTRYHYGIAKENDAINMKAYHDIFIRQKVVKIITLVREPVGRDLSSLFYNIWEFGLDCVMKPGETFIESCINNLVQNGKYMNNEFDWFNEELKEIFSVDIYEHTFDRDKGYSIIRQDNIEVMVIKLERLSMLESAIGEFVGAPHFRLINSNEGESYPYRHLYNNIKEVIKIPRKVFDSHYNDSRMGHFYSEDDKSAFWAKWEKNIVD